MYVRSPVSIILFCNFRPEFGTLLADRRELLEIKFELSGILTDRDITLQNRKKMVKK